MSVYQYEAETIKGIKASLKEYEGKVLVIANTASKCGLTPQYEGLQKLYERYKDQGLVVLGFPSNQFAEQEPGSNQDVEQFCQINYGVSFPLFAKTDVRGRDAHPLFQYLTGQAAYQGFDLNRPNARMLHEFLTEKHPEYLEGDSIKWNFTKFVIDRSGNVAARFEPPVDPLEMEDFIRELL